MLTSYALLSKIYYRIDIYIRDLLKNIIWPRKEEYFSLIFKDF